MGVSLEPSPRLSLQSEVFGETLDSDQPRGLFIQGGLEFHPARWASLDIGVRAGLTPGASRFGAVVGVSVALARFYGGRRAAANAPAAE